MNITRHIMCIKSVWLCFIYIIRFRDKLLGRRYYNTSIHNQ